MRTLRRAPGFTLIAVFALGLGIGVNTTFFTIVNAICLRGLPIESPGRVMYVSTRDAQDRSGNLSYLEFDELRTRPTAFEQVAAYTITVAVVADTRQPPARVSAAYLSSGGFELLGDKPALGRAFRADEDRPGSPPVVILGGELWSSRYGVIAGDHGRGESATDAAASWPRYSCFHKKKKHDERRQHINSTYCSRFSQCN